MAASVRLEDVKNVDQGTQICVYGYIRRVQDIFPENNVYFTIPKLVIHWILLYFYVTDTFKEYDDKEYKVDNDGMALIRTERGGSTYATCYGAQKVRSLLGGVHKWIFKIEKRQDFMSIGIAEPTYDMKKGHINRNDSVSKYYGLWDDGDRNRWDAYSIIKRGKTIKYTENDTVHMTLDLDAKNLGYSVNDGEKVIIFKGITVGIDICYSVIISLAQEGDSVSLLKYMQIKY